MNEGRKLAEGGVLLALYAIMLFLVLYIPLLGTILMFLLPVPFVLFGTKHDVKWSFLFLGAGILVTMIVGGYFSAPITIIFGLVGIVMGYYIRTNKSKLQMFVISTLIFIAGILAMFAVSVVLFDVNYVEETIRMMDDAIEQSGALLTSMGQGEQSEKMLEQVRSSMDLIQVLLPSFIAISSIIIMAITFLACKPIINRFSSHKFEMAPIRDIVLPKSLLWYYLFIMIGSLLMNPAQGSISYTVISNLLFTLQFFILIQGYSLVFFFSDVKGWPKAVPIIITIVTIIIPLSPIIRILGIIDLGFPLRKMLNHKQ
ncbi:MAG: YybS family protein [Bacillus sp. (in: firmicutes)]